MTFDPKALAADILDGAELPANGSQPATVAPLACTDLGNARRLVADHGTDLRFAPELGTWFAWDGRRWKEDVTGEAHRRAKQVADDLLRAADEAATDGERKLLVRHWERSQHASRLQAMVTVAATEPTMPVMVEQLDADPWSLNAANGTINLRDGTLRPHRRGDLLTKMTPVPYDPAAVAPRWSTFLEAVFAGDRDLIDFVQRLAGYSITGDVSEQRMAVAYGEGANGKSTFLVALRAALGEYFTSIDPQVLVASQHAQHPTGLMDLRGARFVATVETEHGQYLAEATVKKLTGGDPVTARRMRQDFVTFDPSHKLWIAANHLPRVRGTDHAIWRRLLVVPFLVTFTGADVDPHLSDKLAAEAPGILSWAVQGCLRWQSEGLGVPEQVQAATSRYREQEDHVGRFIADACVVEADRWVTARLLRERYEQWCADEGERPWTQKAVGAELTRRGFDRVQVGHSKAWTWVGLDIRSTELGTGR